MNVSCVGDHHKKLDDVGCILRLKPIHVTIHVYWHGVHASNYCLLKVRHLVVWVFQDDVVKLRFGTGPVVESQTVVHYNLPNGSVTHVVEMLAGVYRAMSSVAEKDTNVEIGQLRLGTNNGDYVVSEPCSLIHSRGRHFFFHAFSPKKANLTNYYRKFQNLTKSYNVVTKSSTVCNFITQVALS